jgi:hypothetical protein
MGRQSTTKNKTFTVGAVTINTTFPQTHYNAISEADIDLKSAITQEPEHEAAEHTTNSPLMAATNNV